jgi:hypothetical protein
MCQHPLKQLQPLLSYILPHFSLCATLRPALNPPTHWDIHWLLASSPDFPRHLGHVTTWLSISGGRVALHNTGWISHRAEAPHWQFIVRIFYLLKVYLMTSWTTRPLHLTMETHTDSDMPRNSAVTTVTRHHRAASYLGFRFDLSSLD